MVPIMILQSFVMDRMMLWKDFLLIMKQLSGRLKENIRIVPLYPYWNHHSVSTQKKMTIIQNLCNHYKIPTADTIAAFHNSDISYDELTNDQVHPNDAGQEIYFETVKACIDTQVKNATGKMKQVEAVNEEVSKFDHFSWYNAEKDFERLNDTTFLLNTGAAGVLGIDYTYESGDNHADIYVDGELYESLTVTFDYDFSQRHIMVVSEECTVRQNIAVVFDTKEQADGFQGMCFSW